MLEELIFDIDYNYYNREMHKNILKLKIYLKFYHPEENMEYFNRLFDVLGIIDNIDIIDDNYYVSSKFNNYNKNYVELIKIMYKYDFKRWEEPQCDCGYLSLYEIAISYKIEDYIQILRKEWEESLKIEKLEDRN
jgi:hypothetical protein